MRANRDIWIFGDVFLTEAVAVLREMQNLKKDELYLYANYDLQIYYPKLMSTDNFATQIRCELFTALEEHNKLPSIILIVLGNKDIGKKVYNPDQTRRVWNCLFKEIKRAIATRKEDLPPKAKSEHKPRVLITNMFPRSKEFAERVDETDESFKTKRRRFNGLLPVIASSFEFGVVPINGILPESTEFFQANTGQLNGKGMKEFWSNLSRELKIQDIRMEEKKKSSIIQEYFEQQREERRINLERKRGVTDWLSLPRSLHPKQFDRGDGNQNSGRRMNRSLSVPTVGPRNKKQRN